MKVGFIDGCFDGFHYGHVNALYEAKKLCDYLIAATHTDEEIERVKDKRPIYSYEQRVAFLKACKYIDEVKNFPVPYNTTKDTLERYSCDYFFHGEDNIDESPLLELNNAGVLKVYKRTKGISSTDLLKRLNDDKNGKEVIRNNDYIYLDYLFNKINGDKKDKRIGNVVLLRLDWDMMNMNHLKVLEQIKVDYPGYTIYVDLTKCESKIYSKEEIAINLLGLRDIKRVLLKKPFNRCKKLVSINTELKLRCQEEEYRTIELNKDWKPTITYIPGKKIIDCPKIYNQIIKEQFAGLFLWLENTKFDEDDILVLDIDEVCLCNLMYFGYKKKESYKYTFRNGIIPAVKYMKPIFAYLHTKGIKYAFITGREEYIRKVTKKNLEVENMDKYIELYMRENEVIGGVGEFKENCRKDLVSKGYNIKGCVGDQVSDIVGKYTGECFLIHNPFYNTI